MCSIHSWKYFDSSEDDVSLSQFVYSCLHKMTVSKQFCFLLIYCFCSISVWAEKYCKIKDVESIELPQFLRRNSTNILLSWRTEECDGDEVMKISVIHMEYLACHGNRKDYEIQEILGDGGSVMLEELHHFSEYRIELCPVSSCEEQHTHGLAVRTSQSVPRVRAGHSPVDYRDTDTSLTFNWRPPLSSQCDLYQSELGHYHYEIIGVDDWNDKFHQTGTAPFDQTKITLTNLQPFSQYKFFVYVTNSDGDYHQDYFLRFEKRTKAGRPQPPEEVSVTEDGLVSWRASQPPTGDLQRFEISARNLQDSEIKMKSLWVGQSVHTTGKYSTLLRLEKNVKYFIKVRSFNKNYGLGSDWSNGLEFQMKAENSSR